jgi:Spy/CpxP family protein refolding chaperone
MTTIPATPSRLPLRAFALLTLAFVVGVLAGAALEHRVGFGRRLGIGPGRLGRGPAEALRALDLTPDQCAKVDAILARRRPQMDSIMRETFPRMRSLADSLKAEVEAVLTPAQAAKMEQFTPRGRSGGMFGPRNRSPQPMDNGPPDDRPNDRPMSVCAAK